VGGHFATYLADKDVKNQLITFRGHRFNHLYHAAAVTYHHLNDIQHFLSLWSEPNELLKSISFDVHEPVYKAGIRALGLIDKVVTGPFWRLIETVPNVLALNTHLHQLKIHLEAWSKDASPVLAGEYVFSEEHVQIKKDSVYESLVAPSEDPVFESYTQMALELCFAGMLLILERQAKDQLPGRRYWNLNEQVCSRLSAVPTTNTVSERDFAQLDMLMRSKPSAAVTTFEAIIMWSNNKTSDWLNSLSPEEQAKVINEARVSTPEFQKSIKEKQQLLYQKKLEVLKKKQEKKVKQEEKQHSNKVRLTQKITEIGGLWTSLEDLEKFKTGKDKGKFKEAILTQLQFRRVVLNSKGQKNLFQQQHKGQQYTLEQQEDNLKQVIILNLDEEAVSQPDLKLIYRAVDDVQHELSTVKLSLHKKNRGNPSKNYYLSTKRVFAHVP
jgi:E1A/CREB-binding protein